MDKKLLSFVLRSKNRKLVLDLLSKESLTPSQIMKKTPMYESHISRTLKELRENDLILCENPSDRRFKFYFATDLGKEVLKEVKKIC